MTDDEVRERLRFLSAAQHEANTPLAVIRGWAETFTMMWEDLEEGDRRRGSGSIRRHAAALTELLDALFVELRADAYGRAAGDATAELRQLVSETVDRTPDLDVDRPVPELVVAAEPGALEVLISAAAVGLRAWTGGPVTIGVTLDPDGALLVLSPRDHDRAVAATPASGEADPFDPFPGGDPSPAGIRLYAARRLATAVGGRLTASEDGQLRMLLPLV